MQVTDIASAEKAVALEPDNSTNHAILAFALDWYASNPLLAEGIARAEQLYPGHRIRIGAQQYLEAFYASFGFKTVSEPYDEDGIMHVEMLR
jgi:hypothetical protein